MVSTILPSSQPIQRESDDFHEKCLGESPLFGSQSTPYISIRCGFLMSMERRMLKTRMPRMTAREASVGMCQSKNSPQIIFTPMKVSKTPSP